MEGRKVWTSYLALIGLVISAQLIMRLVALGDEYVYLSLNLLTIAVVFGFPIVQLILDFVDASDEADEPEPLLVVVRRKRKP